MAGTRTIRVDYDVINECISNITRSVSDYQIQIDLGKLQMIMDGSAGSYCQELRQAAATVKEAYQTIVELMYESNNMLNVAKQMFMDTDSGMSSALGGE